MNTEISITTAEKIDLYAEMKKRLDELKKAFEAQNANLIDALKDLEAEIKEDVLECGETVRGESMMACWVSGKTTWDGKTLKVLEKQFPEIGIAKKIGEPTVSFRAVAVTK